MTIIYLYMYIKDRLIKQRKNMTGGREYFESTLRRLRLSIEIAANHRSLLLL